MRKVILSLFVLSFFLNSCQKDDSPETTVPETGGSEVVLEANAGDDLLDIADVQVKLNAEELSGGLQGKWTIVSGQTDDKVYFQNESDPKTVFFGLPAETYELRWTIKRSGKEASDTVKVSFLSLQLEIEDLSPDYYSTRLWLNVKSSLKGKWTISNDYQKIVNQNLGGTVIPSDESPHIKFHGYENTEYVLTWEVEYGSKRFSSSVTYTTGNYSQDEALEDLNALKRPWMYKKNEEGNVIEVNTAGDSSGSRFTYIHAYPALQSLIHLKKLILTGNLIYTFPEVIGDKYHDLEVLDFYGNAISKLPDNIGNLQKLDTLIFGNNQDHQRLTTLPTSIGALRNLRYLELPIMGIKHLPESLSNLENLTHLNLALNHYEKLPENIGNLKKLEMFKVGEIDSDLPRSFSGLESLKWCSYTVYPENVSLPEDIGNLINLSTLKARGKYKSIPESFGNLSNLIDLELTGGSAITQIPESFGQLFNLQSLRMDVRLDNLPNSFENLSALKFLRLHGHLYNLPTNIGNLTNLEGISLDLIELTEIPESISELKNLRTLILSRNEIKSIPLSFGNLESLYELDLSYNQIETFPDSMQNLADTLFEFRIRGNNYNQEELDKLKGMLPSTRITTN